MSLIAGCPSQNLVAARIGLNYRYIAMIGSNGSDQTRIMQENEILLQRFNRSLWCSNGNSWIKACRASRLVSYEPWKQSWTFHEFRFQKSVIVLAGKDFLTVYTSNYSICSYKNVLKEEQHQAVLGLLGQKDVVALLPPRVLGKG